MSRIKFKQQGVPSWSWTAHEGEIEYISVEFGAVEWNQTIELVEEDTVLEAQVHDFRASAMADKTDHTMSGRLRYENDDRVDMRALKCVILGRGVRDQTVPVAPGERQYYIMVITPVSLNEASQTYERVGIGSVPGRFISFRDPPVVVHIV
jgi:phenolic acid decarboxylase